MTSLLTKHPWILLIVCFGILIAAWSSLITIAVKFRPERVPTNHQTHP
jgi:hypothetical protein